MSMTTAAAAQLLGVAEREVVEVASTPDGDVVTTHDGVQYLVSAEGQVAYYRNYPKDTLFRVFTPPEPDEADQEAQGGEGEGEDEEPGEVPDGTVAHVLAWVNRDQARAARALAAERARAQPRATLVEQLERLASP